MYYIFNDYYLNLKTFDIPIKFDSRENFMCFMYLIKIEADFMFERMKTCMENKITHLKLNLTEMPQIQICLIF